MADEEPGTVDISPDIYAGFTSITPNQKPKDHTNNFIHFSEQKRRAPAAQQHNLHLPAIVPHKRSQTLQGEDPIKYLQDHYTTLDIAAGEHETEPRSGQSESNNEQAPFFHQLSGYVPYRARKYQKYEDYYRQANEKNAEKRGGYRPSLQRRQSPQNFRDKENPRVLGQLP